MAAVNEFIRVRLDLAYDGTDFAGWARQPGLRTVEGTLEDGLARLLRSELRGSPTPRFTVAGRTDSGVHARGQVAHVDIEAGAWARLPGRSAGSGRAPEEALVARLASVLPTDVVVRSAVQAPPGFDARFSALRRRYTYRIADASALRDPLRRRHVLWTRKPLDVAAMDDAVRPLTGVRDFASYCKPRPGATTIRELQRIAWVRPAAGPDAGLAVGHVVADAFCHNMVRALVGASIAVGEGRRPPSWPAELLASKRRDAGVFVVPPEGLCLEEITFPPDAELAARADAVRAKRMDEDLWDDTAAPR
ncbi:tRNA pseudouridine(38-40) synthase TruA [Promicromonospora sp. NPDC057138]|uniref:tRNA pseudouridine(38-40) synthase TruA n=1 Tax=Promicromonospora sp. NPDC057138 TaxID=3346031 RepID=UPI003628289F